MKNILIASDFTNIANNAMMYGIALAKVAGRKVILMHLFRTSHHVSNALVSPNMIDGMLEKKRNEVEKLAKQLAAENQIEIEAVVRMGDFQESLETVIETHNCGLVVLGMPTKSFEQDLLGNTTTTAIYKLKMPVLAVPEQAKFVGIRNILYACDVARGIHAKVLQSVKEYAQQYNAHLHLFYVGEAIKHMTKVEEITKKLDGVQYIYKEVQSDSVIKAIETEANDINADLIIMTPHKYGFWESIIHRSKTRMMASNGKTPLLSIAY